MDTSVQPYRVSSKIDAAILQSDAIPTFGHTEPFPWDLLAEGLAKQLELEGLQLQPSEMQWLEAEKLTRDLGDPLAPIALKINGFPGKCYWLMTRESMHQILAWVLTKGTDPLGVPDEEFQAGLRKFLAIELCYCLDQLGFVEDKHPMLSEDDSLPTEGLLCCFDVDVRYAERGVCGRVALEASVVQSWREKMGQHKAREVPADRAEQIPLHAHLVTGRLALSQETWEALKPGDVLLPDSCFLSIDESSGAVKGHAAVMVNGLCVAHARVRRNGKVEITEVAQG